MFLRRFATVLTVVLLGTCPGAAQDSGALAAAAPAPTADAQKALWCGAAFVAAGNAASKAGEADAAQGYAYKAAAVFGTAAAELITNGMTVEQFRALAEKTAAEVTAPFRTTSFSEAECEAVAAAAPPAER